MGSRELDVVEYARLAAALAQAGDRREAVLAEHGLDEESYDALEDTWLARLARAEEEHGDQPGVPALVAAHAEAFANALRREGNAVLSFERYAEVTRAVARGADVANVLERFCISLAAYLQAHQHWTLRLSSDAELAERWQRLMRS